MMTPEMAAKLKRSVILHEGYRKFIYMDSMGKLTGGIGYNFSDRGLTDDWIQSQYQQDVDYFYNQLCQFHWYKQLIPERQIVLIDMAFMGWKKFLEFEKMIEAISLGDYKRAALEMLNSEWAHQVKNRAANLAQGMLTGVYDV